MRRTRRQNVVYAALLAVAFLLAVGVSWMFGAQVDNYVYDWMLRHYLPAQHTPEAMILAIDESTISAFGGIGGRREAVARGLDLIAPVKPRAVVVDILLADENRESDAHLEAAFARTHNLVLSAELLDGNTWELPIGRFRKYAVAVGHVHPETDDFDQELRKIPLVERGQPYRALSLEAFRVSRGTSFADERCADRIRVVVGDTKLPCGDLMRVRFVGNRATPRVSIQELNQHPELASHFAGKTVFVGETAMASGDRMTTPFGEMRGVEIHAQAFETMADGTFLRDAPFYSELAFAFLLVVAAGLIFAFVPGWQADVGAAALLLAGTAAPSVFFFRNIVFSFITPFSAAWFSVITAAAYEHLVVRRALRRAEAETVRYQQSLHFVTHEMRTPLTAIQGSSELISRYANMPEEKRKQMALLINSESKRLARMIEMFLNVERLSAGQMELRKETFLVGDLMSTCVDRVRPLAERKQIRIHLDPPDRERLAGDRELMEYAFYNLLTNAVKYSPGQTEVTAAATRHNGHIRISVQDQGIGMDQKEVRKVFQKFYRTKKAEESGEVGTGIGLSIVEQIVVQHGGTIEVTSRPGEGSCFTLVLPAPAAIEEKP